MPVYALEGTPGSGKSLYLVQKIIPDFLKIRSFDGSLVPRHIYTNIEGLNPDVICNLAGLPAYALVPYFHKLGEVVNEHGEVIEDKRYVRYFYYQQDSIEWISDKDDRGRVVDSPNLERAKLIPNNSLVILDEVQNYFGARDFATKYCKDCIDYITRNRHFGHTIWWASQAIDQVDVTFRRNTQNVYWLERLENWGQANTAKVSKYEGWLAGNKNGVAPYATERIHYDKRYFACYKSYIGAGVQEKRFKNNIILNNKKLMIVCGLFLLMVVIIFIRGNPLQHMLPHSNQPVARKATAVSIPKFTSYDNSKEKNESNAVASVTCYTNKYTSKGLIYLVVDNEPILFDPSENIPKCTKEIKQ